MVEDNNNPNEESKKEQYTLGHAQALLSGLESVLLHLEKREREGDEISTEFKKLVIIEINKERKKFGRDDLLKEE